MRNQKIEQERIGNAYPFLRAAECLGRNLLHAMLMQIPLVAKTEVLRLTFGDLFLLMLRKACMEK